jgi:hypothetical protein
MSDSLEALFLAQELEKLDQSLESIAERVNDSFI